MTDDPRSFLISGEREAGRVKIRAEDRCDCKEWKKGIVQIDGFIIFASTHSFIEKYTGAVFKYCPWCGTKLKTILGGAK